MSPRATDRDRDPEGRARNARPRDAAGRPLAHGADGVAPIPDDLRLDADDTLRLAQELLDAERPFAAHEVLEARWKTGPDAERGLWRGLAQAMVGLTHHQRGNHTGAASLLARAADTVGAVPVATGRSVGVDVTTWAAWSRRATTDLLVRADPPRLTGRGSDPA
jgi:uncharacterized protein